MQCNMLNEKGKSKSKPDLEGWCWNWPLRGTAWTQLDWTWIQLDWPKMELDWIRCCPRGTAWIRPDLPEMELDWIRCCPTLDQPHFPQKTLCLPSLACTAPAGQKYEQNAMKEKSIIFLKIFDPKCTYLTL